MDSGWALDPMARALVRRKGAPQRHSDGGGAGVMQLQAKGHQKLDPENEDPFPEPPAGARPANTWILDG